jgi:ATP-dependent DNA helicase RecQ
MSKKTGEYNVLALTAKGWALLKGSETPRMLKPARKPGKISKIAADSWDGVVKGLLEVLRKLRMATAGEKQVPAYVVFSDAALRDMARRRPSTIEKFVEVKGVGQKKCLQYGDNILTAIKKYCFEHSLAMDVSVNYHSVSSGLPVEKTKLRSNMNKLK